MTYCGAHSECLTVAILKICAHPHSLLRGIFHKICAGVLRRSSEEEFWPWGPHLSPPKIISHATMIQTSAQQRNECARILLTAFKCKRRSKRALRTMAVVLRGLTLPHRIGHSSVGDGEGSGALPLPPIIVSSPRSLTEDGGPDLWGVQGRVRSGPCSLGENGPDFSSLHVNEMYVR